MPEVRVTDIETVGDSVIAVKLETPPEFDADPGQFILVRATLSGETETSYYTLSAPRVGDTFEITVAIDPDGTVGPWLAEKVRRYRIHWTKGRFSISLGAWNRSGGRDWGARPRDGQERDYHYK